MPFVYHYVRHLCMVQCVSLSAFKWKDTFCLSFCGCVCDVNVEVRYATLAGGVAFLAGGLSVFTTHPQTGGRSLCRIEVTWPRARMTQHKSEVQE